MRKSVHDKVASQPNECTNDSDDVVENRERGRGVVL